MATIKRALAFLLVLIMILSLGEGLVLADGGTDAASEPVTSPEPSPEPAEEPEESPAPEATEEPEATPEPSQEPEPTEAPAVPPAVEASPAPSEEPVVEAEATPEPSQEPEATPEPSPEAEPEHKQWPWTEPGNSTLSLMSGGWTLDDGDRYYLSSGGLYLYEGDNSTLLTGADAANLNLSGGWLYFTVGSAIQRMAPTGGAAEQVYAAGAFIDQMYVMGQEIRFLSGCALYSLDMNDNTVETLEAPAGVCDFLPTPYGNLFLTGSAFNYNLLAGDSQILTGIDNCYSEGDWLVVQYNGDVWQTPLNGVFSGIVDLQSYSLRQHEIVKNGLSEEQQLANEQAYLESDEYAAIQASLEASSNNGIMTVSTSHVLTKELSANQQNMVIRAQQMADVTWTALADRYAWGGNDDTYVSRKGGDTYIKDVTGKGSGQINHSKWGIFLSGRTYKGVPYSQAVSTGYVGWTITLQQFIDATSNASSKFYKGYSTYDKTAPYYGSDCSGFASYVWDLPRRCTCTSMLDFSKLVGSGADAVNQLEVGYVLNNPNEHVMVVTDIGYGSDGKTIKSVEITEQTPPKMKVTCYGEPISGKEADVYVSSLNGLVTSYLKKGYKVYSRNCTSRPTVNKPANVEGLSKEVAPAISVAPAGPQSLSVTLSHEKGSNAVIYYTTDGSAPKVGGTKYTAPFTLSKAGSVRAVATVGTKESFPLNEEIGSSSAPTLEVKGVTGGVFQLNGEYYAKAGSTLTLNVAGGGTIYYTTNGNDPTISSSKAASGSASIPISDNMTVKAFAYCNECIPSSVVTFKVRVGEMFTITVDDPYGFISPEGDTFNVLKDADVEFAVKSSVDGYELGKVLVDGQETSQFPIKFNDVSGSHTIKTVIKLPFTDVGGSAWFAEPIAFAYSRGLMSGTSDTKFSPTSGASRAMFITVLGRYEDPTVRVTASATSTQSIKAKDLSLSSKYGVTRGEDINIRSAPSTSKQVIGSLAASGQIVEVTGTEVSGNSTWYKIKYSGYSNAYVSRTVPSSGKVIMDVCNFGDLSTTNVNYCRGYAQWAYLNDIVDGTTPSTFGPAFGITRQDICVILYNYLVNYKGVRNLDTTQRKTFSDSGNVSSYAKDAVNAMVNAGILNGDSGRIQPRAVAQRCQIAQIFYNLDKFLNG